MSLRNAFVAAFAAMCAAQAHAQAAATAAQPVDPLLLAARIQQEVADLRGLAFKQPVAIEKQTPEGLGRHLDAEMAEVVPAAMEKHFDSIVRRLGLYHGPAIPDFRGLMRTVLTTQAAAYYDPEAKRVFIISEGSDDLEQGVVYSHELYHALQDQYFGLNAYMSDKLGLDADQAMARTAVVEGEATYMHTLWVMRRMMNATPARALVGPAIRMQADLDIADLRGMIGESAQDKAEIENIPPFLLEILIGNYLKGAAFVFAVQEQGWPAVEKLYREYPPQSTEQILHPEKWMAREAPAAIAWPDFSKQRALNDWELIDDDVLGEIQWRIVFKEHGLRAEAETAAAGWDGDRYAVFKRRDSKDTLLLLRTSWDSEAEATQFAAGYRRVLAVKYAGSADTALVEQQGAEVFIVEGGKTADLPAMMKIARLAKITRS